MAQPTIEQFQLGTVDANQLAGENPDHYESYDIALFKEGKVINNGDQIARFPPPREFTIPANFVGSRANSRTVTAAATVYEIRYNGANIGTVTFALGSSVGTFAVTGGPGPFVYTTSDWLTVHVVTADANHEDISIVIKAEVS